MADRHDEFIRAILDSPFDDGPRRVYADWLEEQGDPRAEFLRLQIRFREVPPFGREYRDLVIRERRVIGGRAYLDREVDREWLMAVDRFTTAPPPVSIEDAVPALAELRRTTTRLHPHRATRDCDQSKVGGSFLRPNDQPWPVCKQRGLPLVPVLQLRAKDAPDIVFPKECDLLQLMWTPYDDEELRRPVPYLFWLDSDDLEGPPTRTPDEEDWEGVVSYDEIERNVPLECAVYPERIVVYPPSLDELVYLLELEEAKQIARITPDELTDSVGRVWDSFYHLSDCPGWRTTGFRSYTDESGRLWEHILTLTSCEYDVVSAERWLPLEERADRGDGSYQLNQAPALSFGRTQDLAVWCCHDGRERNVRTRIV